MKNYNQTTLCFPPHPLSQLLIRWLSVPSALNKLCPLNVNNHLHSLSMHSIHRTKQSQGLLKAILNQARIPQLITLILWGVLCVAVCNLLETTEGCITCPAKSDWESL